MTWQGEAAASPKFRAARQRRPTVQGVAYIHHSHHSHHSHYSHYSHHSHHFGPQPNAALASFLLPMVEQPLRR